MKIEWTTSYEHCHRCHTMQVCLVRWTGDMHSMRKRALCSECLPKDGEVAERSKAAAC